MNTPIPAAAERAEPVTLPVTAWAALQQEARWLTASDAEREVLQRIAMQRDRLHASRQARAQAKALSAQVQAVSADAPLAERLMVFAKLHPLATAAVASVALMIGPRKLLRYGAVALPLISKFKR
jgi:hypothetical protein